MALRIVAMCRSYHDFQSKIHKNTAIPPVDKKPETKERREDAKIA